MGFLGSITGGLLGSKGGGGGGSKISPEDFTDSENIARKLTAASPEELALLAKLGISADQADQGMLDEIRKLGARGDDLANVDQAYMNRAYQPAFERLMTDYGQMDQGIIENMNKRGIASVPGGASEPEAYQRSLLARDTKRTLGQTMLDAQNQAVQQKLGQYNARLAEPNLAATRYGQTMTPYQELTAVPAAERMNARANTAGNVYNAKLGYSGNIQSLNTQRMMQNKQNTMNLVGSGLGTASSAIALSDPSLKKEREAGPDPEQDLQELSATPVDRWKYRWEDDSVPKHEGAMADEAPEDVQAQGGLDIPSYLGKLTNAVKALNDKVGAFDRLMQGGQAHGV
jgi:hypothetical protein